MSTAIEASSRDGWAAERLTTFMSWLPGVAGSQIAQRAIKWATESLEAEVGAVLGPCSIEASIGLPAGTGLASATSAGRPLFTDANCWRFCAAAFCCCN